MNRFAALAIALVLGPLVHSGRAFEVEGRLGRWSVGGYVEEYGVFRVDQDTESQFPTTTLALQVTGNVHRNVRVFLDTRNMVGGPVEDPDGIAVTNLSDTFQRIDPRIQFEEGWVEGSWGDVDLRLGMQKYAWGKLDRFNPTDVLNPRRYTDPFVDEEQDAKIGIPSLYAAYSLSAFDTPLTRDTRLSFIWVPVPVAPEFPLEDQRWFAPAASIPTAFFVPAGTFGSAVPELTIPTTFRSQNRRPSQQLDEGGVGVRATGFNKGVDWSLVYYEGPETDIGLALDISAFSPAVRRKLRRGEMPELQDLTDLQADALLVPRFGRIRLFGGDAAFQLAGFSTRVEAAYGKDRLVPRSISELTSIDNVARATGPGDITKVAAGKSVAVDLGPLFLERDLIEWGVGVDYLWKGWLPIVQVNQTVVLDNDRELLVTNLDTSLFLALRKSFLTETLAAEAGVVQNLARGYTSGSLRGTYSVTDALRVRLGYLLIAGSSRSLIGQFHSNDEGYVQVRYSF